MLLEIFKAVILGIVEGITEFLPVSSTGHLILVNQFLTFSDNFTALFDIFIQLGAILSVVVYFRKKIWPFGKEKKQSFAIWKKVGVGVLPAIFLGALFGDFVEQKLFNPWTVAIMLAAGGVVLIFLERRPRTVKIHSVAGITYATALAIGFIQCLALVPGTSRSAATIIGAMLLGASRSAAVEFSFFLAIPTMVAAAGYSLAKHGLLISPSEAAVLSVGFVVSFIVALAVVRFFLGYIQKRDFKIFGYYRIALGILILFYFLSL